MDKIKSKPSLYMKGILVSFLSMCYLFTAENLFSHKKHWNSQYTKIYYNDQYRCFVMIIEVFDYAFGDSGESGYLEYCDFAYSYNGRNYCNFMRVETYNQNYLDWTQINLLNKLVGADIRFSGLNSPELGSKWEEHVTLQPVNVKTKGKLAFLTTRWFVGETPYQNIFLIRITGRWRVVGDTTEDINGINFLVQMPSQAKLKSKQQSVNTLSGSQDSYNLMKIYKNVDGVVVKGADRGEIIKVYSDSGSEIKSIVTHNEIVKIKLPKNHVYFVKVGENRYKFAL